MGWNGEGLTDRRCPECGSRMDLLSGAWSEQPPDTFRLSCSKCNHYEDMDYNEGYDLMTKIIDAFYKKAKQIKREKDNAQEQIKNETE